MSEKASSEKVSTVIGRVLRLEAQKIDFLLDEYGKIVLYAYEKRDEKLAALIQEILDKYQENFLSKTQDNLADLREFVKE